jgi:sugar-specific transcriptional regulator TrmB
MKTDILQDMGLSKAQIDVYFTIVKLGECTTGPIIKKSKHQNSMVYACINELLKKGLVSFVEKNNRKHFFANDPKVLVKMFDDKKAQLKAIVHELNTIKDTQEVQPNSKVYLGWKGIYTAFNYILENLPSGSEYIAWGAGFENQYTEEAKKFFREYQKKRSIKKYKSKIIVNETSRKQVEQYEWYPKFGKPQYRFVPGYAPVGLVVFGNNILHVAFEETPIAVIISSEQIANSHRKAFKNMWKVAKK